MNRLDFENSSEIEMIADSEGQCCAPYLQILKILASLESESRFASQMQSGLVVVSGKALTRQANNDGWPMPVFFCCSGKS